MVQVNRVFCHLRHYKPTMAAWGDPGRVSSGTSLP
jgi:hypothetical protein